MKDILLWGEENGFTVREKLLPQNSKLSFEVV
jgi:hypothetical protein